MAGDVLQGIDRGDETADQVRGIDHAVVDGLLLHRSGRGRSGALLEERLQGIDVGLRPPNLLLEPATKALERVEQVEQWAAFAPGLAFAFGLGLSGRLLGL